MVPPPTQITAQRRTIEPTSSSIAQEQSYDARSARENEEVVVPQPSTASDKEQETNFTSPLIPQLVIENTTKPIVSSPQIDTTSLITDWNEILPAPKRRKLQQPALETSPISGTSQTEENASRLSRETVQASAEATASIEPPGITTDSVAAHSNGESRKRQISATARGKQRVGPVATMESTGGSADSTRDPPAHVENGDQAPKKQRKPRKKRRETDGRQSAEDAAAEVIADVVRRSSTKGNPKRNLRHRETTPEGAENVRIVPSEMKMSDLCRNLRTGKKSARELELEKLDEEKLRKKKQQQANEFMGEEPSEAPESADQRLERLAKEKGLSREDADRAVPNTIIVDGQIQIDESTLQIDRHADAAVERDAERLEGVDESELTRRVTQSTWAKRDKSGGWNEEQTDKFYESLRMFGTDFQMISKMLPGRTRRSVKLKFTREERHNEARIKRALLGERLPVDLEEYSRLSKTVFADPKELELELEEDRKKMEERQAEAREAQEEIRRQREVEAEAEAAAVANDSSKENRADEARAASTKRGKASNWKGPGRGKRKKPTSGV